MQGFAKSRSAVQGTTGMVIATTTAGFQPMQSLISEHLHVTQDGILIAQEASVSKQRAARNFFADPERIILDLEPSMGERMVFVNPGVDLAIDHTALIIVRMDGISILQEASVSREIVAKQSNRPLAG